jgi:hypothetical protein
MAEAKIPTELSNLVGRIKTVVQERAAKGELVPSQIPYIRYKVAEDFAYGDFGIVANRGMTGTPFKKRDWTFASSLIVGPVRASSDFAAATKALEPIAANASVVDTLLSNFLLRLVTKVAEGQIATDADLAAETVRFLKSISPGPQEYTAKIELLGLIMRTPQIDMPGLVLRQPRREDLEKEMLNFPHTIEPVGSPYPDAIAEVTLVGSQQELHNATIPKLITLLRLFVVAAIKHRGYRAFSGPIGSSGGSSWHPGDNTMSPLRAPIEAATVPYLQKFWDQVGPALPRHLYEQPAGTIDHVHIAYERYCAGLFRQDIFEERVTNAVMGLEALYLEEKQEVAFRCKLRVARAMFYLNEKPKEVFDILGDAYEARNSFAHGDRLSPRKQRKLAEKHKDPEKIHLAVMNYLRKGLVSTILGALPKTSLIKTIDESLADPSDDKAMAGFFAPAQSVL